MEMQFCGGARTVTGSQHLLQVNGRSILLECGLFQGRRQESREKNRTFQYDPTEIDALQRTLQEMGFPNVHFPAPGSRFEV